MRGDIDEFGSRRFRIGRVLLAALLLCTFPATRDTGAQERLANPYTAFHDMDAFEDEGESLRSLRLALYVNLRSWQERKWGLRLRLAGTIATGDFSTRLQDELTKVRVMGIVPGIEFIIPLTRHHMLRPFADLGGGVNDIASGLDILGDLGLRTEFIFPDGKNIYGLEPGFRYSFNTGDARSERTKFNTFITLTARRELGFRIGGFPPDLGMYAEGGYDFQAFELASVTTSSDDVKARIEVGMSFGFSRGRPRVWFFRIPRLRVGYRFGDLTGFRIRLGGDWLTTVAARNEFEADWEGQGR